MRRVEGEDRTRRAQYTRGALRLNADLWRGVGRQQRIPKALGFPAVDKLKPSSQPPRCYAAASILASLV